MTRTARFLERIEAVRLIDTHEHLLDEHTRLDGRHAWLGCNDWGALFSQYVCDDLQSSGVAPELRRRVIEEEMPAAMKFSLIEPHWRAVRNTGYGQALRHAVRLLYGVADINAASISEIAERYSEMMRPGYYQHILRERCGIDHCHVNSMEHPVFHLSDQPDLLGQDISITHLISPLGNSELASVFEQFGKDGPPRSLDEWLDVITSIFDHYGPHAAAVKTISAYLRRLDFGPVDRRRAEAVFRSNASYQWAPPDEVTDLENFLLRFCLEQARRHNLPVKFHTGHHAGCGTMKMAHVAANAADLAPLVRDFPDVRFVIFHIGYPHEHEFLSLAKHYPNLFIDMCWAWIIDPVASVLFLKRLLVTAPSNKVTLFGGDYLTVEPVIGHLTIARSGIAQALGELVDEGWLAEEEAFDLIGPLMRGNAEALYGAPKPGVEALPSSRPAAALAPTRPR